MYYTCGIPSKVAIRNVAHWSSWLFATSCCTYWCIWIDSFYKILPRWCNFIVASWTQFYFFTWRVSTVLKVLSCKVTHVEVQRLNTFSFGGSLTYLTHSNHSDIASPLYAYAKISRFFKDTLRKIIGMRLGLCKSFSYGWNSSGWFSTSH